MTTFSTLQHSQVVASAAVRIDIPAGAYLQSIAVRNPSGSAITGGLKFGTTSGGTDVYAALAVGANSFAFGTDALTLKRIFGTNGVSVEQGIYVDAVSSWNGATGVIIDLLWAQL